MKTTAWFQSSEAGPPFEAPTRLDAFEASGEITRRFAKVLAPFWIGLFLLDCVQIAASTYVPVDLYSAPSQAQFAASVALLLTLLVSALVWVLTFTFAPHLSDVMFHGAAASPGEAVRKGLRRYPVVLGVSAVVGVALTIGLLFCIVPGFFVMAYLGRAPWEAAQGASFFDAFRQSVRAAKRFDPVTASLLHITAQFLIVVLGIRIAGYELAALLDVDPQNLALALAGAAAIRLASLWAWFRFAGTFVAVDAAAQGRLTAENQAATRLADFPWLLRIQIDKAWARHAVVLIETVLLIGLLQAQSSYMIRSAGPAPKFELVAIEGEQVPLAAQLGSPTVLYFWAPWCGPCKAQVLALKRLQEHRADAKILSIACDYDSTEEVRKYAEDHGLAFDVLLGDMVVAANYGVAAFPTTFVLDADGQIRFANTGYRNASTLAAQLDEAELPRR